MLVACLHQTCHSRRRHQRLVRQPVTFIHASLTASGLQWCMQINNSTFSAGTADASSRAERRYHRQNEQQTVNVIKSLIVVGLVHDRQKHTDHVARRCPLWQWHPTSQQTYITTVYLIKSSKQRRGAVNATTDYKWFSDEIMIMKAMDKTDNDDQPTGLNAAGQVFNCVLG